MSSFEHTGSLGFTTNITMTPNNDILHYGKPRRSGRYPWGSGDDPFQRITRGKLSKKKQKKIIKDAKGQIRNKPASEMTDKELKNRTDRLRAENSYEQEKRKREEYEGKKDSIKESDKIKPEKEKPSYYGKSISEMTDEELKAFVNRMDLQSQAAKYTKKSETAGEWFKGQMQKAGKTLVGDFIDGAAKYGAQRLLWEVTKMDKAERGKGGPARVGPFKKK